MKTQLRACKIAGLAAIVAAAFAGGCDKEENSNGEEEYEDNNSGNYEENYSGDGDEDYYGGGAYGCYGEECHDLWSSDESRVIIRESEPNGCYDDNCFGIGMTDPEQGDLVNGSDIQADQSCPQHYCMSNPGTSSSFPAGINVQVYVITKDNVSAVSQDRISNDFKMLNLFFQPMGLIFPAPGGSSSQLPVKYLEAPQWWDLDVNTEFYDLLNAVPQGPYDGWPMFYVRTMNLGEYLGVARLCNNDGIVLAAANWMDQDVLSGAALETATHEFGHQFCLYHTHETDCGVEECYGSNCATAGDFVCDTPADRYFGCSSVNGDPCWKVCDDCNPGDTSNLMSYYHGCRDNFTEGQRKIMTCYLNELSNQ